MTDTTHVLGRRRLLGGLGAVASSGVAGCGSFGGPQTDTGRSAMITIVLSNADATERAYDVEVDWGDDNRSRFAGTLQPEETNSEMVATTGTAPESAEFLIDAATSARSGTWSPTECPNYRVDAVIEDGNPSFDTSCRS